MLFSISIHISLCVLWLRLYVLGFCRFPLSTYLFQSIFCCKKCLHFDLRTRVCLIAEIVSWYFWLPPKRYERLCGWYWNTYTLTAPLSPISLPFAISPPADWVKVKKERRITIRTRRKYIFHSSAETYFKIFL